MATDKCDKCNREYQVPPWLCGVYYNRKPKTLCRSCYAKYCKTMDEAQNKFWESEGKPNEDKQP